MTKEQPTSAQYADEAARHIIASSPNPAEKFPQPRVRSTLLASADPADVKTAVTHLRGCIALLKPRHPRLADVPSDARGLIKWLLAEYEVSYFERQSLEWVFFQAEANSMLPNLVTVTPITRVIDELWDELDAQLPQPTPDEYCGSQAECTGDYGRLHYPRHVGRD